MPVRKNPMKFEPMREVCLSFLFFFFFIYLNQVEIHPSLPRARDIVVIARRLRGGIRGDGRDVVRCRGVSKRAVGRAGDEAVGERSARVCQRW